MSAINSVELENYIYLSVVLPLKSLVYLQTGNNLSTPSSGLRLKAQTVKLSISRQEINRSDYRHNYQRDRAQDNAVWYIKLSTGTYRTAIIGTYETHLHGIKLYSGSFQGVFGKLLMGKLEDMFHRSYPFKKVEIVSGTYESNLALENVPVPSMPRYEDSDEDDYDEDYDD